MAGELRELGAFLGTTGNPTTVNESTTAPFAPGDLGKIVVVPNTSLIGSSGTTLTTKYFQKVILDASSAVTLGMNVTWKDYSSYTVTTVGSTTRRNDYAGIIVTGSITGAVATSSATAGNLIWVQIGGLAVVLVEGAQTPAAGDALVVGGTTAGRIGVVAQGTAPTSLQLGVFLNTKTTTQFGSGTLPTDYAAVNLYVPRFAF